MNIFMGLLGGTVSGLNQPSCINKKILSKYYSLKQKFFSGGGHAVKLARLIGTGAG
jgi:hypothetical protein